jgi:outer membrane protein assembly factor BamD
MDYKYQMAKKYYAEKQYYRAQPLFDELINFYKGTKTVEDIYYYDAYSYYGEGEYIMAQYNFKNFVNTYPANSNAQDCSFQEAYCYFMLSPKYELDQDYTNKAIQEFQLFTNIYPNSPKVAQANQLIDQLRLKLQIKEFAGAHQYYNLEKYNAAAVAFKDFLLDYPESSNAELGYYMILKSDYLYANNSIEKRKKERFNTVINAYNDYMKKFKDGTYYRNAQKIYKVTLASMNNIGSKHVKKIKLKNND